MRYLKPLINQFIQKEKKMAFIAGPRQVGKTTLTQSFLPENQRGYFNWDIDAHQKAILKDPGGFWQQSEKIDRIVLDEIHKYPRWKKFLKGLYDDVGHSLEMIVTGSGRLDIYQKGGDSLLGRYGLTHLHPFSVGEFIQNNRESVRRPEEALSLILAEETSSEAAEAWKLIEKFGGFPEPLFAANEEALVRWQRAHRHLVIREDLRDLTRIREIGLIDALVQLLPERIGSPLSLNSLREDLGVAFGTVQGWITNLSRLYYLFALRPFAGRLARTLRREEKIYLFDPTAIEKEGARFENLVALHLKKACDVWNDWGFGDFDLFYLRDKEKREVDFLITKKQRPYLLVECKLSDQETSKDLLYFSERLKPTFAFQIVRELPQRIIVRHEEKVVICAADRFLARLPYVANVKFLEIKMIKK